MRTLITILCVIGGIAVLAGLFFWLTMMGMGEIRKLVIRDVDLSKIADGVYVGTYHKTRWTYDVEVTVKDHKISGIKNTNKRMAAFKSLDEKVVTEILRKQTPQIDIVSGATINTRAFQKAVENALDSAAKK